MNPLDRILATDGANLRRENPANILTRKSAETNDAAAAKASEFARLFPGIAAGRPAESISTAQLGGALDVQSEIAADPQRKRLYDAALDFQGIFIGKMLKSMRSNLNPENDLLFGGNRQQIFEDMLYDEYSKAMSRSDGFDLADQMYKQLSEKMGPVGAPATGKSDPNAAGKVSTDTLRQARESAEQTRARQLYESNSNQVSTEQIWNENDWRP